MRKTIGTRVIIGLLACITLPVVAGTTLLKHRQATQPAAQGQISKAQILSRSESILQALLPGTASTEVSAYQNATFNNAGQSIHHWSVDCTEPGSGDIVHLFWDADSGELLRASRFRMQDRSGAYNEPSPKKQAVNLAWDWFRTIKIEQPLEAWRVVGARKKPYAQWDVYFRSGGHYAIVTVNTCSGQLVQATSAHLADANMAWIPPKIKRAS
jgi:hypothetical protein